MNIDASNLLAGLGGAPNVLDVEACITRLRVEVNDPASVDEDALRKAGAFGVVLQDSVVQVVVGPVADDLTDEINELRKD
ncbi:glucose PTS transporter subunit EIIB [Changpingibacter yushuensis]|uniref:glucose PTS transporter subunit EIIB n=1 Tax=Changpingibacter yushuensis TaxID=2758440 RepID=UPI0015F66B6F|nr:glucose PTS transporter subunit EIIB [Changpingibacter yushuensis]